MAYKVARVFVCVYGHLIFCLRWGLLAVCVCLYVFSCLFVLFVLCIWCLSVGSVCVMFCAFMLVFVCENVMACKLFVLVCICVRKKPKQQKQNNKNKTVSKPGVFVGGFASLALCLFVGCVFVGCVVVHVSLCGCIFVVWLLRLYACCVFV